MPTVTKHFGPPGTGKTTTLLAEVLSAAKEHRTYLYLVYNRSAAHDARARLAQALGGEEEDYRHSVRTLHSLCWQVAGHHAEDGTHPVEEEDRMGFCDQHGLEYSLGARTPEGGDPEAPFAVINAVGEGAAFFRALEVVRHRLLAHTPSNFRRATGELSLSRCLDAPALARAWETYKCVPDSRPSPPEWKRGPLWDHTDNLVTSVQGDRLASICGDLLAVDEFQDFTPLMYSVYARLREGFDRIHLGGDDDQCIYSYLGADPRIFLNEPGEVRVLGQSHRLPQAVHTLAMRILAPVRVRQPKSYRPRDAPGFVVYSHRDMPSTLLAATAREEGDILGLARTNHMVREAAEGLLPLGVPFSLLRGRSPWQGNLLPALNGYLHLLRLEDVPRAELKALLSLLPVAGNLVRGAKTQVRKGVGDTIPYAQAMACFVDSLPPLLARMRFSRSEELDDLIRIGAREYVDRGVPQDRCRVRLGTIHAAKGLEAPQVVLLADLPRRVRQILMEGGAEAWEQERRVWYVGVTRAREGLWLVHEDSDGAVIEAPPSASPQTYL